MSLPSSDHKPDLLGIFVHHKVAANLLMVILLGGGLWSAVVIPKEVFPEYLLDVVEVRVGYPGAAPSEVEQGILLVVRQHLPLEQQTSFECFALCLQRSPVKSGFPEYPPVICPDKKLLKHHLL